MLRETPSPAAVGAASLMVLALLAASFPARADGLPALQPALPGFDCYPGLDAGNTYETAWYLPEDSNCTGTVTPLLDEQDWFAFFAFAGTRGYASLIGFTADVELCLFGPSSNATPLGCSTEPLLVYDNIEFEAAETGTHRLQVRLAAGAGMYSLYLNTYPPPPHWLVDVAVVGMHAEKPVLRTDVVDTGVVNPIGAWKLSADLANLGEGWECPEVYFFIQGEPLLPEALLPPYLFGSPGQSASVEVADAPCLAPGQSAEASVDWRPLYMVGDVEITVVAYSNWDANWDNNERSMRDFVLVGGL